jgi:hypothetical protein
VPSTQNFIVFYVGRSIRAALAEDTDRDDGVDRGIILAFVNADPVRQFAFVQPQWANDGNVVGEGTRTDPIVGRRDRSSDYVIPQKRVRYFPKNGTQGTSPVSVSSI